MVTKEEWVVIRHLREQGLSVSAIARQVGRDRKTVRKYLARGDPPLYGPRAKRPSKLDPFKAYLRARVREAPLTGQRLLREIRALGYTGGYTILKDYLREIRPPRPSRIEVRFETPPGLQAQWDFGIFEPYFTAECRRRRVHLLNVVLGYSRYMTGYFLPTQDLYSVLRGHVVCLEALGGVPGECLYDRMKTVVLGQDEEGRVRYHPALLALAAHYGFVPKACRPYRPKTKGKVERPFGYIRSDFFVGRSFRDLEDMNLQYGVWLKEVANQRIHGTTGKVPAEELLQEGLKPLPPRAYERLICQRRAVSRDGFISFGGSRFSVPQPARGRLVEVRVYLRHLEIFEGDRKLATHRLPVDKGATVMEPAHRPSYEPASVVSTPCWMDPPEGEGLLDGLLGPLVQPLYTIDVERRDLAVYQALEDPHG